MIGTNGSSDSRPILGPLPSRRSGQKSIWSRIGFKRLIVAALCCTGIALAWWLREKGVLQTESVLHYRNTHPFGFLLLFMGAYAVSVLFVFPTLPFNLLAGALWGPILGGLIAVTGMASGAIIAFCAARFLFGQPLARRFDSKLISWLQNDFADKGWRLVAFLRLNPVFPTGPVNYILGLTSIDAGTYIWATILFLLPPGIVVALAGSSVGSFLNHRSFESGFRTVLLISTAITILIGIRYAARYFHSMKGYDHDTPGSDAE